MPSRDLPTIMKSVTQALNADELAMACSLLEGACAAHSHRADLHALWARIELKRANLDGHDAAIARAIALEPGNAAYRIRAAIACPPMMSTVAAYERLRARTIERLDALAAEPGRWVLSDPQIQVPTLTYYFVYHGQDDREINRRLATVLRAAHPALTQTAPHLHQPVQRDGPIRLGIFSTYLRDHTIGCLFSGLIEQLDPRRFRRVLIFSEADLDERAVALAEAAGDEVVLVPRRLSVVRQKVASQRLDVLWYPDLGMDSLTMLLAHARLAHAQVTTWGHPNSSGIPTVDAFVSLDALEPDRENPPYTERLLCQSAPNIFYRPTRLRQRPTRAQAGLPVAGNLYGCPQTLFKMHPDFDQVLCGILKRDPRAVLVLHQGRTRVWRELFVARLEAIHPGASKRIHSLTGMPRTQYIHMLAALDVMLDPFPFGGGNTTLEALAVETPVVTLPPRLARGRLAAAFCQRLGWLDGIAVDAEDYVARAVRLATDAQARQAAISAIRAGDHRLFENLDGVRQFEDLLERSLQPSG